MKAVKEIVVTREEVEMINNFFEACEKLEVAGYDRLTFLEAITDEDKEYYGIDIVIRG